MAQTLVYVVSGLLHLASVKLSRQEFVVRRFFMITHTHMIILKKPLDARVCAYERGETAANVV